MMKHDSEQTAGHLRQSIQDSLQRLAKAVDAQQSSKEMRQYLDMLARFHRYSWQNTMLIALAKPDATHVAGFNTWKKLGRCVRRGEKGIRILAPCPVRHKEKDEDEKNDDIDAVYFKTVCVFDVLQTEGEDLPAIDVLDVEVSADRLLRSLEQVAVRRGIAVQYQNLRQGLYGRSKGGEVEVGSGYATGQQAKTLAHELIHERIHHLKSCRIDRNTAELEAEAVAYVVCRHFGLDVELRSSRYITLWGGDSKALAASLSRISAAARDLIEDVEAVGTDANAVDVCSQTAQPSEGAPIPVRQAA